MKGILKLVALVAISFSSSVSANWIPFTLDNNFVTIDIHFNGQPAKAILDSGSEMNAVSQQYLEKYPDGISRAGKVVIKGINGKETKSLYSNIPIEIFGNELKLHKVAPVNMPETAILFGTPFFKNIILQIDYPNSRLRVLPKGAIDMYKYSNVEMKRQKGSKLPAIRAKIGDKKTWLTFDTGNNSDIVLKRHFLLTNDLIDGSKVLGQGVIQGVNRSTVVDKFTVPSVTVGPFELENVSIMTPAEGERSYIGLHVKEIATRSRIAKAVQTKGIVGYELLKHFLVTVDYSGEKLHLSVP